MRALRLVALLTLAAGSALAQAAAPPAPGPPAAVANPAVVGAAPAAPGRRVVATASGPIRPVARPGGAALRCAAGGTTCIEAETYAADVCRVIGLAAGEHGLHPGYLARLLWRESLFDAGAMSPAGAQGIAQFMPGTAARRGLADPFDPAEAILASAAYLRDLERMFGNLGLAAAAYNAGEARTADFVAGTRGLPGETRAYVVAITGHGAEAWRAALDGVELPAPDYALDPDRSFAEACLARAERRSLPALGPGLGPWGVYLAGRDSREAAAAEGEAVRARVGTGLADARIDVSRERLPGMAQARWFAQVGQPSRAEAESLCDRVRSAGAGCLVRRNEAVSHGPDRAPRIAAPCPRGRRSRCPGSPR